MKAVCWIAAAYFGLLSLVSVAMMLDLGWVAVPGGMFGLIGFGVFAAYMVGLARDA